MPIANDGTRNLVGRIDSQEMTMFDVIADGDVVVFCPTGKRGLAPFLTG